MGIRRTLWAFWRTLWAFWRTLWAFCLVGGIAGFIRVFSVIFVILISPPNPGEQIIQISVTIMMKNVVLNTTVLVDALN